MQNSTNSYTLAGSAAGPLLVAALALLPLLGGGAALAQEKARGIAADCGNPFVNAHGPFDYRLATPEQRNLVESFHFTPGVESLKAGATGPLGADIDYTLRAFPNHPRALNAMARLAKRDRQVQPRGAKWTIDCYFERAVAFAPDDPTVRQVLSVHLASLKRYDEAIRELLGVLEREPDNPGAHYNIGLMYFEKKDYKNAASHAKRARELGFPLDGLQRKLRAAGVKPE